MKIIVKVNFLTIVLVLTLKQIVIAQDPSVNVLGNVTISSPTAASLGKYVDYPVNYHTGTPQINIPLYVAKSGELELPISLSYHASGLKVQELASWVGAGWSLNAGGVITRTINGLPDDKGFSVGTNNVEYAHWTDYGYNNYLQIGGANQPNDYLFWGERYDGEPDMFFYNFGNYSGKFYFRDDRTPVLVPEQDLKIEVDYGNITTPLQGIGFRGFTITTPNGVKYYFGSTQNTNAVTPIEITNPLTIENGLMNGQAVSSWYLNKITSKDGLHTITLNYENENYSYYTLSMFPLYSNNLIGKKEYKPVKQFVNGVRLSSIKFSQGQINFFANNTRSDLSAFMPQIMLDNANTEAKSLSTIQISSIDNQVCKQFDFTYSYFQDMTSGLNGELNNMLNTYNIQSDMFKLKLNSIQESSCDHSMSVSPYQFSYYDEKVPRLLSFGIDHWGFYNGVDYNNSLIPTYTINNLVTVNGANRDASWPAMRGGALKKITYPQGGYTEFNYEPHDTYKVFTTINKQFVSSASVLYDGSTYYQGSFTTPTLYNTYTISFSIMNNGVNGVVQIFDLSGNIIVNANSSSVNQNSFILNQNSTYIIKLWGTNTTSGWGGCTATIYALVPTTNQLNVMVGGLRIKSTIVSDLLSANNVVTNYSYNVNNGTQSSGILYSLPIYVSVLRNNDYAEVWGNCSGGGNGCATYTGNGLQAAYLVSPNSVRPMMTTQGNHIGYNEVRTSQNANGYSIYRYYGSNYWDSFQNYKDIAVRNVDNLSCDVSVPSYPFAPLPFEFLRGELKYEGHFNQSGQILKDCWFYPQYQLDPISTPGYICRLLGVNSQGGPLWGTEYNLQSYFKTQDKKVETIYDPDRGTYITTSNIVDYKSNYHHEPTKSTLINSTNNNITKDYTYAFDYRISTADAISNGFDSYQNAILNLTQQYYSSLNSCSPQPDFSGPNGCAMTNCRFYKYNLFRIAKSDARKAYIQTLINNISGPNSQFKAIRSSAKNLADFELKPILELQDENHNALIETVTKKDGLTTSATYMRYDYSVYPSNFVYSKQLKKLAVSNPINDFVSSNTATNNSSITRDGRYQDEGTVDYYNGNLVQLTPRSGAVKSYLWGYNNTYPVAEINGLDYNTAKNYVNQSVLNNPASDQAIHNEISNIKNNFPTALVNSYAYKFLLGISSQKDPSGKSSSFEYDKLSRLKLVRDQDNNILKKYCYNYMGQAEDCMVYYKNVIKSGSFQKNNCVSGGTGSWVTYSVAAGTYSSTISQADADTKAQDDVNNNGQAYANANGSCTLSCNCYYEYQKCINNICETGVKIYTFYSINGNGRYTCVYHYEWSDGSWSRDYFETSYSNCSEGFQEQSYQSPVHNKSMIDKKSLNDLSVVKPKHQLMRLQESNDFLWTNTHKNHSLK